MEAQERIIKIANAKIPVSEDSPIYPLFAQRRELCRQLKIDQNYLEYLEYVENDIRNYLCL